MSNPKLVSLIPNKLQSRGVTPCIVTHLQGLFAYSVMHDRAPCYLAELLSRRQPNRRLRSASLPLLTLPASQKVTHGDRCFVVAAAALWNGLPDSVRTANTQSQYKTLLKTHLFRFSVVGRGGYRAPPRKYTFNWYH